MTPKTPADFALWAALPIAHTSQVEGTTMKQLYRVFLASLGVICLCSGVSSQADSSQASTVPPSAKDSYTITSVLRVLPPVDPAAMTDEFQTVRVLAQDKKAATVEITYHPLHTQVVGEDPNWRKDDAGMTAFLRPTPAENWDAAMRRDLLAQLRHDGIEPNALTDKQLVQQVSRWAMQRAHTTNAFATWDIYYPGGKPAVYPALRGAFEAQKPTPTWTDQQMFDQEALGKGMFYGKVHGSCTSSSIYLTTIFRALGIPTRTVICIPPFDPNDPKQAAMFYNAVHYNQVRETVRTALGGLDGFANHLFNEVYVGHHWVRLNYDRLGQPILDASYFGLLTHIATSADLSRTPLAATWGLRYNGLAPAQPALSSVNPYMLLSVHDNFDSHAHLANPEVPVGELRTATITALLPPGSPALPEWVRQGQADDGLDFFLVYKEWVPGSYYQMRAFAKRASRTFLLTALGHPDIKVQLNGTKDSADDGTFQAFGVQVVPEDKTKLVPGIAYTLTPQNISNTYRWAVAPGVTLTLPALPIQKDIQP